MKKVFSLLLFVTMFAGVARAQEVKTIDTLHTSVYFHLSRAVLDLRYKDNEKSLDDLVASLARLQHENQLHRIRIVAAASPEGGRVFNQGLSERRGNAIKTYLKGRLNLSEDVFAMDAVGADWKSFIEVIEKSNIIYKEDILRIARMPVGSGRMAKIKRLGGGEVWRILRRDYLPPLRNAQTVTVEVLVREVEPEPVPEPQPEPTPEPTPEPAPTPVVAPCSPFYGALRTNLLYDLALVPNIGLELYLGKGWSAIATYYGAWWDIDAKHYYWRVYGGDLEVRKYFGRQSRVKPLTGHHVGVYGIVGRYDFQLGGNGYMSDLSYGAGLSYGYSLPIHPRLNLDFSLGGGWLGGDLKKYAWNEKAECYELLSTRTLSMPMLTKAEITLVWRFGCDNLYPMTKDR